MKALFAIVLLCFTIPNFLLAQEKEAPKVRFLATEIGDTKLKIRFPIAVEVPAPEIAADGDKTYSIVTQVNNVTYGAMVIQFATSKKGETIAQKEKAVCSNLVDMADVLGFSTKIETMGRGHTLDGFPKAIGVIDYWGNEKMEAQIKGWMDDEFFIFMMIVGNPTDLKQMPYTYRGLFFDSVKFPNP